MWDPEGVAASFALARKARSKPCSLMIGPITIEAVEVDSVVRVQCQLNGGDLLKPLETSVQRGA